ncbi:MAG: hemolysin family protein [Lentisphaeria bacterium]|nr:hemolysin family protein [Lentisphaeria bacterium]
MADYFLFALFLNFLLGIWLVSTWNALDKLKRSSFKKLEVQHKEIGEQVENWLESRDNYLVLIRLLSLFNVAMMIGIGFASLQRFPSLNMNSFNTIFLSSLGLIVFFLFFTESLSGVFIHKQYTLLSFTMPVLKPLSLIFYPVITPAIKMNHKLEDLTEEEGEDDKSSLDDEIEALLDQEDKEIENLSPEEQGSGEIVLQKSTGKMIRGILDLDETLAKEIMTPRVDLIALSVSSSILEIKEKILESGHSRIPVYKKDIDDIIGVIYSKHLLMENVEVIGKITELMNQPVYIPETKNVASLLDEFKQNKVHIAVVIDEYGGTAGIITLEDILEEIVGEISDEFDSEEIVEELLPDQQGVLTVEGRTPIDDINDALGLDLPEEEDNVTIGGFVTSELGRIPNSGELIEMEQVEFQIVEADERKILQLQVRKKAI